MSTLSARAIDLATYYSRHEGLHEGAEVDTQVSRIRSLHPYAVGIELYIGEFLVGAWAEIKPFDEIIDPEILRNASSVADLPEGSIQRATDKSVADKLSSIWFPHPFSAS